MPRDMPAGGYVTDVLLFLYVAAALLLLARIARRAAWPAAVHRTLGALGVLAGLFTGAEAWLRYVHDAPTDGIPTLTGNAWIRRHWSAELNAAGFRGGPWAEVKPRGTRRIVLLGDEVAAGWGVEDRSERVGERLERALGPGHEVWSVGVPGWSTGHRLAWIGRSAAASGADRIVLLHALDDAADLVPGAQLDIQRLADSRSGLWNPSRSFLVDELWVRTRPELDAWRVDRIATVPSPAARQAQVDRMRRVVAACRSLQIPLDVVIVPWLDPDVEARDAVADAAVRAWREAGAANVHDLRPRFRGREEELRVAARVPWPGEAGHAVLADALRDL